MSRFFVFFTLGTIMIILSAMATFKLDQEFSIFEKFNKYKNAGEKFIEIIEDVYASKENNTPKQLTNTPKSNPFIPPRPKHIENNFSTSTTPEDKNTTYPDKAMSSDKDTLIEPSKQVSQKAVEQIPSGTKDNSIPTTQTSINNTTPASYTDSGNNITQEPSANAAPIDEIFVWVTEAPTVINPNEKPITQVRLTIENKELSFRIVGSEIFEARTMLLQNPERFVIDIQGNWAISLPPVPSGNPWLKKIRTGSYNNYTRLVLELQRKPTSTQSTQPKGNILDIQIQ